VHGIWPSRLPTQQRLLGGAGLVAVVSLLNLIAVDLGQVFGSPWPVALMWAICGWAALGPNVGVAFLLFVLGLWADVLSGAALGTWSALALITYGLTLLVEHYLGTAELAPLASCAVTGLLMLSVMALFGVLQNQQLNLVGNLTSICLSVGLYHFVSKYFELPEDET
jgi:hypothetical protein